MYIICSLFQNRHHTTWHACLEYMSFDEGLTNILIPVVYQQSY